MSSIANLAIKISGDPKGLTSALDLAQQKLTQFHSSMEKIGKVAAVGGAFFLGAEGLSGLSELRQHLIEGGEQAEKFGLSMKELQTLEIAGGGKDLSAPLTKLTRNLAEARSGLGQSADAFKEFGLDAKQLSGLSLDQVVGKISDRYRDLSDPLDRANLLLKVAGKSGLDLTEVMRKGSGAIDEIADKVDKYGLALNSIQLDNLKASERALNDLKNVTKGLGDQFAANTAPGLESLAKTATNQSGFLSKLTNQLSLEIDAWADLFSGKRDLTGKKVGNAPGALEKAILGMGPNAQALGALPAGAFEAVSKQFGKAIEEEGKNAPQISPFAGEVDALTRAFEQSIASIGKSSNELKVYELQVRGASDAEVSALQIKAKEADAASLANKVENELRESVRNSSQLWDNQANQLKVAALAQKGLTQERMNDLQALAKQADQMALTKKIYEETKSPLEGFQEKLAQLDELSAGNEDLAALGKLKAVKGLQSSLDEEKETYRPVNPIEFGTQAAFSAVHQFERGYGQGESVEALLKRAEEQRQAQLDAAKKLVDQLDNLQVASIR
jgi:hypothetical protein